MAKIHEEFVVIKLSKLVKEQESTTEIFTDELTQSIEGIVQELVESGIVVEVVKE